MGVAKIYRSEGFSFLNSATSLSSRILLANMLERLKLSNDGWKRYYEGSSVKPLLMLDVMGLLSRFGAMNSLFNENNLLDSSASCFWYC